MITSAGNRNPANADRGADQERGRTACFTGQACLVSPIGERNGAVGGIPDPDQLQAYQAHWSWFVTWSGTFINDGVTNPRDFLTRLYADPYVLTRDELGDFKNYTGSTNPPSSPTPSASGSPAPSEPPASEPASPSPSHVPVIPSMPASPQCTATHRVLGQWPGGHQVEVTVTNTGATPMTSWRVQWESSADQSIAQHWSAVVTSTGTTVSAANVGWNGALNPRARTTFGYLATGTPDTAAPALTCG